MIALNRATLLRLLKPVLTILAAALAALVLWHLYTYYTYAPQTRDGKIRADVVPLAADVSGRVEEVHVRDNQVVRKGELLFTIDRVRLRNALAQAEAAVAVTRATLDAAERENRRYRQLGDIVSGQQRDERRSQAEEARARYTQRSEEHTSETQSLMRISYAVFYLYLHLLTPPFPTRLSSDVCMSWTIRGSAKAICSSPSIVCVFAMPWPRRRRPSR